MNESSENKLNYDKVSLGQLGVLINLVSETQKRDVAYLSERYARSAPNFEETLTFLKAINLIEEVEGQLQVRTEHVGLAEENLKKDVLKALFKSSKRVLSEFHDYIENFVEVDGKHSFRPTLEANMSTSGLRNLLIQLGFMENIRASGMYVATELGESFLSKRPRKFTAQSLSAILRSQERLGTAAEEAVIKYEHKVLASCPELVGLVRHMAQEDVGAGYDVYSVRPDSEGGYSERYIEVKAVSADSDFYWSLNEVNTAKAYGSKYYLYLVPVMGDGQFDTENMAMISDPYRDLFEREEVRAIESVSFHITPRPSYLREKRVK